MSSDVILFGAGSMVQEVYELSFCNGDISSIGNVIGYASDLGKDPDFEARTGLSYIDLLAYAEHNHNCRVLLCIGDPVVRKLIAVKLIESGVRLQTFVHPAAIIAKSAKIGAGVIIYPFVVVSSRAQVGDGCIINSYTGVGHDVEVGDYCTLSAQVDLTGSVKLGECVFMGSGSRVVPKKKIGAYSKISAGITVIRTLSANSLVFPHPTKLSKP